YRITVRLTDSQRQKTLERNPDTGETFAYPEVTYYPGGLEIGAATLVQVPAGVKLRGFEERLRHTRVVALTGQGLARAGGKRLGAALVELSAPGRDGRDEPGVRSATGSDGSWDVDLLVQRGYGGRWCVHEGVR